MCDVTPSTTVKDAIDVLYSRYIENVPRNIIEDLYRVYPSHHRISSSERTTITNELYKRISEWYCRFLTIRLDDLPVIEMKNDSISIPITSKYNSSDKSEYCQKMYLDFSIENGVLHASEIDGFDFIERVEILSGSSTEGVFEHNSSTIKFPIIDGKMWGNGTSFLPFSLIKKFTRIGFQFGSSVIRIRVFGGKFDKIINIPERLIFDIGGVKFYTTEGAISRLGELDSRHHLSFNRDGILHFF